MKKAIAFLLAYLITINVSARSFYVYTLLISVNDEKFILIDRYGEKLFSEAKSYCFHMNEGDTILSTDSLDSCVSATLINIRNNEVCEVWCQ